MKIQLDKTKADMEKMLNWAKILGAFGSRWILALIASILLIYAAFLWYACIANPGWSESQKQAYSSTKQNEAVFDQKKFDAVTGEIEKRKTDYGNNIENVPDIFGLNK